LKKKQRTLDPQLTDLTLALRLTHLTPAELTQWIRDLWIQDLWPEKGKGKVSPPPSRPGLDSGSKTAKSTTSEE
jgi:hypothetical protein